jgi:hypothetical protein
MSDKTPMLTELHALAALIAKAKVHHDILQKRFGLSPYQIDVMAQGMQARQPKPLNPMRGFKAAVIDAKKRMAARKRENEIDTKS